jgi:hypothetical protein
VALGLCREWDAAQKDPHGKAMSAESRHALAAVAGREADIPAFCAKLLASYAPGGAPASTPTQPPAPATPTPSHPGNGNGNGNGKGRAATPAPAQCTNPPVPDAPADGTGKP